MPVSLRSCVRSPCVRLPALRTLIEHILGRAGHSDDLVSVTFIGDRRMRQLNRDYRGSDRTTDVLAFATREAPGPSSPLLGEVVISVPQAIRQARARRQAVSVELAVLLIHGVLHLVGYDHERNVQDAQQMRRKERAILDALGPIPRLIGPGGGAVSREPRSTRNIRTYGLV